MFITLLVLILLAGLIALGVMISKTNGDASQPSDVIPYVETPGDLATELMESRWED